MDEQPRLIQQAYRYALKPTPEQEEFLGSCAGASRYWFNQGLALVKERLDQRQEDASVDVPWSYKALCSTFAPIKDEVCPWRKEVVVGSQQAGLEGLGRALQNFSRGRRAGQRVGFPKFRAKGRCRESVLFQCPQVPDNRHVLLHRRLGPLRTGESLRKLTRLLGRDPRARILRSTVSRQGQRWFISFTVERSPKRRRAREPRAAVGVDVGLATLATLSTGEHVGNRRPLQARLKQLRSLQRRLDRQRRANNPGNYLDDGRVKPGPKEWTDSQRMLKTRDRIQRLHERVANLRREQAHQLSTRLTREYGVIGVESLNVSGMLKNRRLAGQITDAGWGLILRQLEYKTSWVGSLLVSADTFYPSSKACSSCGTVRAKLLLSERIFSCHECGLVLDRDKNAARNLAHQALLQAVIAGVAAPYVARTGRETRNAREGARKTSLVKEAGSVHREDQASAWSSYPGNRIVPAQAW